MQQLYLGIDAGTTRLKIAIVDDKNNILAMKDTKVDVIRPFDGACEIDMLALWDKLCYLIKDMNNEHPNYISSIIGIGISAQGDGAWIIDKDGKPIRNAIIWNDTRAKQIKLDNIDQIEDYLLANYATPLVEGSCPMILKWLKLNEIENYNRARFALHCKDWLNYKLTGNINTDYTDASTASINIIKKEYLSEIFEMMGISEAIDKMPKMISSTDITGYTTQNQTGLPQGIPVIAGAIDITAACLGAGVRNSGESLIILGTTLCNEVLIEEQDIDIGNRKGSTLCSVINGKYLRVMATLSGTSTIDWAKNILAPDMSFDEIDNVLKDVRIGSNGVVYHPYIYGERSPFKNSNACGGFYGLTAINTQFDMLRAVYEGLALSTKDCWNYLPKKDGNVYIAGGGANSEFLCQLTSDFLDKAISKSNNKEMGICGIVEAVKIALGKDIKIDTTNVDVDHKFNPNNKDKQTIEEIYNNFIGIRDSMKSNWDKRAKFVSM